MIEIGSEFNQNAATYGENKYSALVSCHKRHVLSGRTGLHLIAKEIKSYVSSISLPDYCCASMIEPFVSQGCAVSFYDAFNLSKNVQNDTQAVLITDYFGFIREKTVCLAEQCKKRGKVVIVDATHSAFSYSRTYELADYIIVSYRKWFDCLCATVYSRKGFITKESEVENEEYLKLWRMGAALKEKYINHQSTNKQDYLDLFSRANHLLTINYSGYKASASEIEILNMVDSNSIRKVRRQNATFLIDEITKLSKDYPVKLMFGDLEKEDCPLFVPILLDKHKRKLIQDVLINNNVYCPIHWPLNPRYPYHETPYHMEELSLVCDQRYGIEDMKQQILELRKAFAMFYR